MKRTVSTYKIAVVGMMAALVFVASGLRIVIPVGTGNTAIHLGNVFCLLSGMILGGPLGGLAAGIGSALYDLTNPLYANEMLFTFAMKFAMGYICGTIANRGKAVGGTLRSVLAGGAGQIVYIILYISKGFAQDLLNGAQIQAAGIVQLAKLPVSITNAIIAVTVSVLLAPVFVYAMKKAGIYSKLRH